MKLVKIIIKKLETIMLAILMLLTSFTYLHVPVVEAISNSTYGIVYFRTKGCSTNTNYTVDGTGKNGYTNGCYGADAAFLGYNNDGSQVKFKMSGVTGWVSANDVKVFDYMDNYNWNNLYLSNYTVKDGILKHNVTSDIYSYYDADSIKLGPKPAYLTEGKTYYSYDGHYFYSDAASGYRQMIDDYRNGTNNSINKNDPYYNYYQYLSHRTISNYTSRDINKYLKDVVGINATMNSYPGNSGESLLYGEETSFVQYQNEFGANLGLVLGVARNESASGTSNIAFYGKNLFGHSAFDSSPGASASSYLSVAQSIFAHDRFYISEGYLDPCDGSNTYGNGYNDSICNKGRYNGSHSGDKASGLNVKYASDPYWGDKASQYYYLMDSYLDYQDYNKYTIAIKQSNNNVNIYRDATINSNVLYKTGTSKDYPVVVLEEVTGDNINGNNKWYKIQTDAVLNSDRTKLVQDSGYYDFNNNYGYVHSSNFIKVNTGKTSKPRYNITFDPSGGTYSDGITANKTLSVEQYVVPEINAPTKAGDRFTGWSPNVMGASSNMTYKATWANTPVMYDITFNASGGAFSDGATSHKTSVKAGVIPSSDNPIKEGYTFIGWSPNVISATSSTSYTALWGKNSYDITFNASGGEFSDGATSKVVKTSYAELPVIIEPTRSGYEFAGWDKEIVKATNVVTYTATWKASITYDITFDADGGKFSGGLPLQTLKVVAGKIPSIQNPTKPGYSFKGWEPKIVAASTNTKYTATWNKGNVEDNLIKGDGNFYMHYLKDINGKLQLQGYQTITGINNDLDTNINYEIIYENIDTGDLTRSKAVRITNYSEIPKQVYSPDGKDYTYSWFNANIDIDKLSNGNYKMYVIAYTDLEYTKSIISNKVYNKQDTNYSGSVKKSTIGNNYDNSTSFIELKVRDELLANKNGSFVYNQYDKYTTFEFNTNSTLHLAGNTYSYGMDLNPNKQDITRKIIFENTKNYTKYKRELGTVTNGRYPVFLPVSDSLDKTRAWYDSNIDVSSIPVGEYIIYITTASNIEDIAEMTEKIGRNLDNVKTITNGKTYTFSINKNRGNRIQMTVK